MRTVLAVIVVGLVGAAFAPATAQPAASAACTCAGESACTEVDGVQLVSAQRPIVRRLLRATGAVPLKEPDDPDELFDSYTAHADAAYTHVDAAYYERRLWELRYIYPDAAAATTRIDELGARFGKPVESRGEFDATADSLRVWRTEDGVEVSVARSAGQAQLVVLRYTVTSVKAELDAWLRREPKVPTAAAPGGAGSAPGATPEAITISPRQGVLVVGAKEPILLGARELRIDVCGEGDGVEGFDSSEPTGTSHFIVFHAGGAVDVQIAVHDGKADLTYSFRDVSSDSPARSMPLGDCKSHLEATYRPTRSPLCVAVVQTNQPTRLVIERLVATSGVTVDGVELLPNNRITLNMDLPVRSLLDLISDADDTHLEQIDATHFAFRR